MPTIKQNLGRVRIDNKGPWKPGTYDNLDVVTLGGSSYMCIEDGTTTEPTTLQGWDVLAAKGDTGEKGDRGDKGEKGEKGDRGEKGDTGLQGTQGIQGVKGDPFTYGDFTQDQIAELQRPATEAAAVADKANKDAQAAIAEVKATEAKLYPAAENILKGKVKETFIQVDDAFAGAALREITVEGACRQDGTPSPDSPVPIEVIEHPVVKVTGRNFAEVVRVFDSKDIYSSALYAEADIKPSENYIRSFDVDTAGNQYYLNESLFTYKNFSVKKGRNHIQCSTVANISKSNPAQYNQTPEFKGWLLLKNSSAQTNDVQFSNVQLERGSTVSDYVPYASQSQSFTLPAEHPYLAKFPDGIADEIVVDKDGNVELVARVFKVIPKDIDTLNFGAGTNTDAPYVSFKTNGTIDKTNILCNSYKTSDWTNKSGYIYRPNSVDITIRDDRFTSKEKAIELLNDVIVYVMMEPTRYQLGKIEMPKAQDSITNVWTDAEITPRTGIEYTRDVNIVVSNLESAIASITEG